MIFDFPDDGIRTAFTKRKDRNGCVATSVIDNAVEEAVSRTREALVLIVGKGISELLVDPSLPEKFRAAAEGGFVAGVRAEAEKRGAAWARKNAAVFNLAASRMEQTLLEGGA